MNFLASIGRFLTCTLILVGCSTVVSADQSRPLWVVVGRTDLVSELSPLVKARQAQGFETIVHVGTIEAWFSQAARHPDYLLLVGDDHPEKESEAWYLPAKRMKLYRWRAEQRKDFSSDALFGDLDGDLVPDIPVGRIPARTPSEVELVVQKILAFEDTPPTIEDLQIAAWCGSVGFGDEFDTIASGLMLMFLETHVPRWLETPLIVADPKSPLCGWPPDQSALFTQRLRQGGICHLLMGHANAQYFYSMPHQDRTIWYSASDAQEELSKGQPCAPLIFFTCESGRFDASTPCIAESFLFFPKGPVATIAATTESHPLTNYFSAIGLFQSLNGRDQRIGDIWLKAQRKAFAARNLLAERILRDVEGKLEDDINVDRLRRDQLLMYALLGDPATRLRVPLQLPVQVERADAGWRWQVDQPKDAKTLHVYYRPADNLARLSVRANPTGEEAMRKAFDDASAQFRFTSLDAGHPNDPWSGTIDRAGWLRFVAVGHRTLHATAVHLK